LYLCFQIKLNNQEETNPRQSKKTCNKNYHMQHFSNITYLIIYRNRFPIPMLWKRIPRRERTLRKRLSTQIIKKSWPTHPSHCQLLYSETFWRYHDSKKRARLNWAQHIYSTKKKKGKKRNWMLFRSHLCLSATLQELYKGYRQKCIRCSLKPRGLDRYSEEGSVLAGSLPHGFPGAQTSASPNEFIWHPVHN